MRDGVVVLDPGRCRMERVTPSRRMLLVHAHPDDETINNGATMARYVAEGASVTLLTCTLGEEGEVLVPELELLAAEHADQLGGYRIAELRAAMEALGVPDWRFLGGPGRYRDSGMMGTPANEHPRAFWNADLDAAVAQAVAVVREVRPQVVVTYDQNGGYGHPDHIQAHRVAMYGAALAAVPSYRPELGEPWDIAKIYWTAMSMSQMRREAEELVDQHLLERELLAAVEGDLQLGEHFGNDRPEFLGELVLAERSRGFRVHALEEARQHLFLDAVLLCG